MLPCWVMKGLQQTTKLREHQGLHSSNSLTKQMKNGTVNDHECLPQTKQISAHLKDNLKEQLEQTTTSEHTKILTAIIKTTVHF